MGWKRNFSRGIWLLFLAHSLVQIRTRGAEHPVTEAELEKLCVSDECRISIVARQNARVCR